MVEGRLHLTEAQLASVLRTLRDHAPAVDRAWVFGSRARGHAVKPHADLDLLIDAPRWTVAAAADLAEAFSESDLPFRVDVLRLQDADAGFVERLMAAGAHELPLTRALHA